MESVSSNLIKMRLAEDIFLRSKKELEKRIYRVLNIKVSIMRGDIGPRGISLVLDMGLTDMPFHLFEEVIYDFYIPKYPVDSVTISQYPNNYSYGMMKILIKEISVSLEEWFVLQENKDLFDP